MPDFIESLRSERDPSRLLSEDEYFMLVSHIEHRYRPPLDIELEYAAANGEAPEYARRKVEDREFLAFLRQLRKFNELKRGVAAGKKKPSPGRPSDNTEEEDRRIFELSRRKPRLPNPEIARQFRMTVEQVVRAIDRQRKKARSKAPG